MRAIDKNRIREMLDKLEKIPSPLNAKSKFNGVSCPVLTVLMMILRQAARDGYMVKEPDVPMPRQGPVRRGSDDDADEEVANPERVEALYEAMPDQWAIAVQLGCLVSVTLRRVPGLQRREPRRTDCVKTCTIT